MTDTDYSQIEQLLKDSEIVFIYAGAGMSADLGIKTYWSGNNSLYGFEVSEYGYSTLEHANASMWKDNYEDQKQYSLDRLEETQNKLSASSDNVYTKLLKFLKDNNKDYSVATSNTDGAFLHYGFASNSLSEVHGNQNYLQCNIHQHGVFPLNEDFTCITCGSPARSNVFMFDDYNFQIDRETKQSYRYLGKIYGLSERVDDGAKAVVLEIGVGDTVPKIRNMARKKHRELEIPYIHVNPAEPNESELEWSHPNQEFWLSMTGKEFSESFS